MQAMIPEVDKLDFTKFLTDSRKTVNYNKETFNKEVRGSVIKIKANDEVVYQVHKEKKVLIVLKAIYMTFHRDEFWGIAKQAGLEEILADRNTLIRI
ncbi:MAG: hypothetical protein RR324_03310 [Cellulosilyticaceae bacterium]